MEGGGTLDRCNIIKVARLLCSYSLAVSGVVPDL